MAAAPPHRRLAASIAAALMFAPCGALAAQDPVTGEEEQAWQDQVIAPDQLAPLPPDESEGFDATGLPRSFRLEALLSRTERGDETFNEGGLAFSGFRETEAYGNLSLDASLIHSNRNAQGEGSLGGIATLWQRGLFMGGGWRGNNGLGVLNTPSPDLLREQFRFFLPSVPFAGASTEWRQPERGLQLQAALGRAGVFEGARVVGFDLADGNVGTLGAQWKWSPHWRGAVSALATDGRLLPDDLGGTFYQDGRTEAVHFATGWDVGKHAVNFNLQSSDGDLGGAWGAWADARQQQGRFTHRYGVFNLEPALAWGAQPIANDSRGAYYRAAYQHARWNWSAGVDRITSVSGNSFDGWYGTGYARYQATASTAYGGNLAVRRSGSSESLSGQWFMDRASRWGLSRLQLEHASSRGSDQGDDSWRVTLDQALPMRRGQRLSLSAAFGELAYDGLPATSVTTLAAYGGFDIGSRLTIDGTARWNRSSGGDDFRGTDLNLNLAWRVANRWWLVATVYENQGTRRSPFIIDPLATEQPFVALPRDRAVFLSLRYEREAGTSAGVLGGAPGSAFGSIAGSVYLDENGDGERAASELPASNVTVLLDGRYSVRTDSQGNFEFPRVAVGAHTIEVVPDNLPLPWFLDEQGDRRAVEVQVREAARVDIGARRQR